jgi:hypothetical protein
MRFRARRVESAVFTETTLCEIHFAKPRRMIWNHIVLSYALNVDVVTVQLNGAAETAGGDASIPLPQICTRRT